MLVPPAVQCQAAEGRVELDVADPLPSAEVELSGNRDLPRGNRALVRLETEVGLQRQRQILGGYVGDLQVGMGTQREGRCRLAEVLERLRHAESLLAQGILRGVQEVERVAVLREDLGLQPHRGSGDCDGLVAGVAQQPVDRVDLAELGDVEALFRTVQPPDAAVHAVGPGGQENPRSACGNRRIPPGLGEMDPVHPVGAQRAGERGDDGGGRACGERVVGSRCGNGNGIHRADATCPGTGCSGTV